MMKKLLEVEQLLPGMICDGERWNSLYINYHPPFVMRLWRQWGNCRVYLHNISCEEGDEPLFHPHPWPSAMRVLDSYEMKIGYGPPDGPEPRVTLSLTLAPGSTYLMADPQSWHSVLPTTESALSVMVSGKPFTNRDCNSPIGRALRELPETLINELLFQFMDRYPVLTNE